MKLKKGKKIVELAHEAQIAAYKNAGYAEVKETKKVNEDLTVPDNLEADEQ